MKIWVDDVRPAPQGYVWRTTVNDAKKFIEFCEEILSWHRTDMDSIYPHVDKMITEEYTIELIDLDHDAGDCINDGGDYINLLDWLEETGRNYPIRIHSMNPVGRKNMEQIILKNGWKLIR